MEITPYIYFMDFKEALAELKKFSAYEKNNMQFRPYIVPELDKDFLSGYLEKFNQLHNPVEMALQYSSNSKFRIMGIAWVGADRIYEVLST